MYYNEFDYMHNDNSYSNFATKTVKTTNSSGNTPENFLSENRQEKEHEHEEEEEEEEEENKHEALEDDLMVNNENQQVRIPDFHFEKSNESNNYFGESIVDNLDDYQPDIEDIEKKESLLAAHFLKFEKSDLEVKNNSETVNEFSDSEYWKIGTSNSNLAEL